MALTNVQKNIASTMQQRAISILEIRNSLDVIVQMYATENMAQLTDVDYQALPELAHVTVAEMNQARNALEAIALAIGDYAAATNATKLTKIIQTVPR